MSSDTSKSSGQDLANHHTEISRPTHPFRQTSWNVEDISRSASRRTPATAGDDADQLHRRLGEFVVVTQQCKDDRELRALFELKMGGLLVYSMTSVHKVDDVSSCNAALLALIRELTIDHTDSHDSLKRFEGLLCSGTEKSPAAMEKSPAATNKSQHEIITVDDDSDSAGVCSPGTTSAAHGQVAGPPLNAITGTLTDFFSRALVLEKPVQKRPPSLLVNTTTFEGMPKWTVQRFKVDFEKPGSLPGLSRCKNSRQLKQKGHSYWSG
jgi:hypothetical protein